MQIKQLMNRLLLSLSLILVVALGISADGTQRTPCDQDKDGPWIKLHCIEIQQDTHTSILLTPANDAGVTYTIFDNKLDRDCIVVIMRQPNFWSADRSSDSLILYYPWPADVKGKHFLAVYTDSDTTITPIFFMP